MDLKPCLCGRICPGKAFLPSFGDENRINVGHPWLWPFLPKCIARSGPPPVLKGRITESLRHNQRAMLWQEKINKREVCPVSVRSLTDRQRGEKKRSVEKSHPRNHPKGTSSHGLCANISRCCTECCQPRSSLETQTRERL